MSLRVRLGPHKSLRPQLIEGSLSQHDGAWVCVHEVRNAARNRRHLLQ